MFSITQTPFSFLGFATIIIAAESTSWWLNVSWGYSFSIISVATLRHRREVARTLALSMDVTGRGGFSARAICAAARMMRSISSRE
jgi:hypothetical protein